MYEYNGMKLPPLRETPAQRVFREDVRNDPLRMPERLIKSPWQIWKEDTKGLLMALCAFVIFPIALISAVLFLIYELLHLR